MRGKVWYRKRKRHVNKINRANLELENQYQHFICRYVNMDNIMYSYITSEYIWKVPLLLYYKMIYVTHSYSYIY